MFHKIVNHRNLMKIRKFSTENFITAHEYLTDVNRKNFENRFKKLCSLVNFQNVTDKYSAVLLPILVDNLGNLSLLYTRRSALLRTHVRQISFPGGAKDETDISFDDCALRETEEEIGLSRNKIKIWASGDFIKPPHTAAIMPIVGIIENFNENDLIINKFEVDEIIIVSIKDLCEVKNIRHTQFKSGYSSPVFIVHNGNVKIWGITGMITKFFLNSFLPNNIFKNKLKYIVPYKKKR